VATIAPRRFFEDFPVGTVFGSRETVIEQDAILAFAREFDPQYIHTDPTAAATGPFDGLIASGWHTAAVMMRLLYEEYLADAAGLASPGIDELRWLLPVRPGDRIRVRGAVVAARRSRSRPDRGLVTTELKVVNQRDEVVMSLRPLNLFLCRSPE
jgi:acyl dehydratase